VKRARSEALFAQAQEVLVGGVNSPVRAFKAVGGAPPFFERGHGARLTDVDGNEYVDFVGSWGPLVLGHAHPKVVEALQEALVKGTSFGAPAASELALAELVRAAVPSMERVRLVNSGTEAAMSARRLARAHTGRDKIVKFQGGYHGHADYLLVQAGSGVTTLGLPDSPGVPRAATADTLSAPYNDLAALDALFERFGSEIAAVIVEPVAGNMGVVPPRPGFLEGLCERTRAHGALLVFDEVMTGFRVAFGGAQARYGVTPDLTCLGKVIGGGLPVGAYGGPAELMDRVAPAGPVYQAGTLSGNPLAMAAGVATLTELKQPGTYDRLEALSRQLAQGLEAAGREGSVSLRVNRVGAMLTPFFSDEPVADFEAARRADHDAYARLFHGLLDRGIYPPPSGFEAWFPSLAHGEADVAAAVAAAREALKGDERV